MSRCVPPASVAYVSGPALAAQQCRHRPCCNRRLALAPLRAPYLQVAISSYGYDVKCGAYVTSGVVTAVRHHSAWIQATIAKLLRG